MADFSWLTARPIAHRGYHDEAAGRIENTLSAVSAAIDHRFAVEIDLQLTADRRAVLFHDDALDRLTESRGAVSGFTLAELQAVRLRGTADRIPTIQELLDLVGGKVPLVIELKSDWDGDRRLEQAVAPILMRYGGPVAVMSFDPSSMRAMRRLAPGIPRGLVADSFAGGYWEGLPDLQRFALKHLLGVATVRPSFVSYGIHALPAAAPMLLRRLGLPLITWTVRTPADVAKAARYADQITFEGFDPDAV